MVSNGGSLGNAILELTTDSSKLDRGLNDSRASVHGWAGMVQNAASIAGGMLMANVATAVGSGITSMIGSSISLAGQMEQSRIAFTTMLGSAQKAEDFLGQLSKFAAETPFEMKGLQDASKKLLAFGFDSKQIIPMLTAVGNAASGLGGGPEMIDHITLALGQMQAKGKVSAQEMMQLAEAGVPAWDMLAKKIGVSVPEAMKLAEKGAIPAGVAIDGLISGMNERFPDMMKKQSTTMLGVWSTLQDTFTQTLTHIGEIIVKAFDLTSVITTLTGFLTVVQPALEFFVQTIAALITGKGFDVLYDGLSKAFGPDVAGMIAAIVDPFAKVREAIGKLFAGDVLGGLASLGQASEEARSTLITGFTEVVKWVGDQLPGWIEKLGGWASAIIDWVGPQIPPLLTKLGELAAAALQWVIDQVPGWIDRLGKWATELTAWIGPRVAPMLEELGTLLSALLDWLIANAPGIAQTFLSEWAPAAIKWVAEAALNLLKELPGIIFTIDKWIATEGVPKLLTLALELGKALTQGIIDGLKSLAGDLFAAAWQLAADAVQAAKNAIGMHSPARAFIEIGQSMNQGMQIGLASGGAVSAAAAAPYGVASRMLGSATGGGRSVVVNFHGDVYGMADFQTKIAQAVKQSALGGGFYGVPGFGGR